MKTVYHIARVLAAVILLQTLYYKFGAHPESVALFTEIGMEPQGRIATGVVELIAGILLLFGGRYVWVGAGLGVLLMIGAIYYHATLLGIDMLFWMAVVTLVACLYVLRWTKKDCNCISAK